MKAFSILMIVLLLTFYCSISFAQEDDIEENVVNLTEFYKNLENTPSTDDDEIDFTTNPLELIESLEESDYIDDDPFGDGFEGIDSASYENLLFNDIEGHWAKDYILKLASIGLINGYGDGTFKPNNNISRAEFYKLLAVAFSDNNPNFANMTGKEWYSPYIDYAFEHFLIPDGVEIYSKEDASTLITRKEAILAISRALIGRNDNKSIFSDDFYRNDAIYTANGVSDLNGFTESEYMGFNMVRHVGIIGGYEDGTMRPENNLTRAEVSKIIYTFIKCILDNN